ncbi:M23 family metallopeptidase [Bdellovibrio sp. SKB1291214]|uniref:M23 family metallopeptidase n=1 Tax=Bdellovibrio sp. SKB1291214 TaxID=1732569 RepID=UPI000B51ABEC|nr:M23 family metallopeptidase [Bdellovibrio sp. SKB1291214]UYL08145.1 M23 family metallopeptidase [Bdellovibrio sp. SKB1291214]
MTPGWKQLVNFAGCIITVGTLGSCTTFHTPLSREVLNGSPSRGTASDQPMTVMSEDDKHFDWPVDSARMTRGFLPNKRRPHLGIDLAAPKGTPILAAQGGTIIYAGREFKGYGKMVLIESGDGWATLYAHFDKILVSEGQKVRKGEVIGAMGRTGRATGVHLHFEIRKNRGPIDPLPLLPDTAATSTAQL